MILALVREREERGEKEGKGMGGEVAPSNF